MERPYQRPVPGPREARTPDHPGGGERTPQEHERTHTQRARRDYQKGNRTELAERTDRVEWRTVRKGLCHVFLGGLDPGQAPLKTLLLMLRLT